MSKSQDNFLYQINFNRKKYPEICEALERAKEENGIAFYLRQLIMNDIQSKRGYTKINEPTVIEQKLKKEINNNNNKRKEINNQINNEEFPDDSGAFI